MKITAREIYDAITEESENWKEVRYAIIETEYSDQYRESIFKHMETGRCFKVRYWYETENRFEDGCINQIEKLTEVFPQIFAAIKYVEKEELKWLEQESSNLFS